MIYLHVWQEDLRRERIGNQKARASYQQSAQRYVTSEGSGLGVRGQDVEVVEKYLLVPVLMGLYLGTNGTLAIICLYDLCFR